VSLIRKFWFYFSPKHFLIGDTATTKVLVITITGFQLWHSKRFHRHDTYAREVLFWQGSGFRFRPICFCTTRFGSAPLGSVRTVRDPSRATDYRNHRFGGFDNQRIKSDRRKPQGQDMTQILLHSVIKVSYSKHFSLGFLFLTHKDKESDLA